MVATVLASLTIGHATGWFASLVVRAASGGLGGAFLGDPLFTWSSFTDLFVRLVGACVALLLAYFMARRLHARARAPMPDRATSPAAIRDAGGALAPVPHADPLLGRFSADEIVRLTTLRLRCRERPDALDQPIPERRLQFARWLVEHGRLGENIESGEADRAREPAREASSEPWRAGSPSERRGGAESRLQDHESASANTCWKPPANRRVTLLGLASRIWRRSGPRERSGRPRDISARLPDGADPWSPFRGPREYFEAPWLWMGFSTR